VVAAFSAAIASGGTWTVVEFTPLISVVTLTDMWRPLLLKVSVR